MQKKLLCLLFCIFLLPYLAFTEEVDWGSIGNPDNAWDGQKQITNKEYEEVVKALEERKNKGKKKKKFKGQNLNNSSDSDMLTNIENAIPLLNLTVKTIVGDNILIPGHYKIVAQKKGKDIYLNFYQGHSLMGKVLAYETEDDFDTNDIYFIKTKFVENNQLLIMFGSMEFNAFAYLNYLDN